MPMYLSRESLLAAGLAVLVLALPGCATKKDISYRNSALLPPLTVPQGLDTPAYTQAMDIPSSSVPAPGPADGDIEKPPAIARGQEDTVPAAGEADTDTGNADEKKHRRSGHRPRSGEVDGGTDRPYP